MAGAEGSQYLNMPGAIVNGGAVVVGRENNTTVRTVAAPAVAGSYVEILRGAAAQSPGNLLHLFDECLRFVGDGRRGMAVESWREICPRFLSLGGEVERAAQAMSRQVESVGASPAAAAPPGPADPNGPPPEAPASAPPRSRRMCIATDLVRYGDRHYVDQREAQAGLADLLEQTCAAAGLVRSQWQCQPAGDGELAVLPTSVDEGSVVKAFIRDLRERLFHVNRRRNERSALRLRIGMSVGFIEEGPLGYPGAAPVHAARLRDCQDLRSALAQDGTVSFGLVLSNQLFEDHVADDHPDFRTTAFRSIRVEMPDKNYAADAWMYLAGDLPPRPLGS